MSSPSLRIRRRPRLLPVTIVAAVTALALTGCEPGVLAPTESPEPTTAPSPSFTVEPSETPDATEEPVATETPEPSGSSGPTTPPVAGDLPCSDVFTDQQLYDFNPNFAPTAAPGQLPGAIAEIADAGGTVCVYQHVTSDADRLVIGVLQDAAGFSAAGFETVGAEGVATVPADGAVVSMASVYFASAQDAQPYVDQVIGNIQ